MVNTTGKNLDLEELTLSLPLQALRGRIYTTILQAHAGCTNAFLESLKILMHFISPFLAKRLGK